MSKIVKPKKPKFQMYIQSVMFWAALPKEDEIMEFLIRTKDGKPIISAPIAPYKPNKKKRRRKKNAKHK